jgi:hypothetical protein
MLARRGLVRWKLESFKQWDVTDSGCLRSSRRLIDSTTSAEPTKFGFILTVFGNMNETRHSLSKFKRKPNEPAVQEANMAVEEPEPSANDQSHSLQESENLVTPGLTKITKDGTNAKKNEN